MIAEVTLDLGTIGTGLKFLFGFGLFGIGLVWFFWPTLPGNRLMSSITVAEEKVKVEYKRRDVDRSSDMPPPKGFADHLNIIETAAPNAGPEVWWEYAKSEMTEAEVALAEAKLARQADSKGD